MIKSTAKKKGIAVVVTEETYTSVACFYDGDMPKKGVEFSGIRLTHSLYRTREGRMLNADINALNIYRKCSPEAKRLRCMGITCPRRLQVMNP
ncbi:MAG: transposase [Bacilli bacterium]|nr:transposase [Bacilli bacterium]